MVSNSYASQLVGLRLEGYVESNSSIRVKLIDEVVELHESSDITALQSEHAPPGSKRRVVVKLLQINDNVYAKILPPSTEVDFALNSTQTTPDDLVCVAIQRDFTDLPLTRKKGDLLTSSPFTLFQVPQQQLDDFLSNNSNCLKGYRIKGVYSEGDTQYGVVDLMMSDATSETKFVLASGLPFCDGIPGEKWSIEKDVFDDLPFKVDVYIYPGDHERIYFGEVDGENEVVKPYGSLLVSSASKKVAEAVKNGTRVTLEESNVGDGHDSFLVGVLCSRIVLDRGCDPTDPSKPGAWEVVNSPNLVLQLCFALSMSKSIGRLDRGENPSPSFYIKLTTTAPPSTATTATIKERKDREKESDSSTTIIEKSNNSIKRKNSTSPPPSKRIAVEGAPPTRRPRSPPPRRK